MTEQLLPKPQQEKAHVFKKERLVVAIVCLLVNDELLVPDSIANMDRVKPGSHHDISTMLHEVQENRSNFVGYRSHCTIRYW